MKSFVLNGLTMISGSQPAANILLQTPITGLDAPEYRMNQYSKTGQNGSIVSSMFYDRRTITLTGKLWASNPTDYENARKALANACAISKDANGYPQPLLLTFTTLADNSYNVYVYPSRPVFDYDNVNSTEFLVTLNAADAFLYATTEIASATLTRPAGGGFVLPVLVPIVSTAATGGAITITNSGAVEVFPKLALTGPLTSPIVYNQTTGKNMKINYTINSGDVVLIDMNARTVTLNGSSSLISYKDANADWWSLAVGNNNITLDTSSSGDTGNARISFYPQFINA